MLARVLAVDSVSETHRFSDSVGTAAANSDQSRSRLCRPRLVLVPDPRPQDSRFILESRQDRAARAAASDAPQHATKKGAPETPLFRESPNSSIDGSPSFLYDKAWHDRCKRISELSSRPLPWKSRRRKRDSFSSGPGRSSSKRAPAVISCVSSLRAQSRFSNRLAARCSKSTCSSVAISSGRWPSFKTTCERLLQKPFQMSAC